MKSDENPKLNQNDNECNEEGNNINDDVVVASAVSSPVESVESQNLIM